MDELAGNRVVITLGNSFEVLVHLISEYYKGRDGNEIYLYTGDRTRRGGDDVRHL